MSNFPQLPPSTGKHIPSSTVIGIMSGVGNRYVLINNRTSNTGGSPYVQARNSDDNSSRRRVMTLNNAQFRTDINNSLSGGGTSNVVLDTLLGLAAGATIGPVGWIWTGVTLAIGLSTRGQEPVRVRRGDEIHQVEVIGRNGSQLEHMELLVLVDPFRASGGSRQWVLHENRIAL